VTPFSSIKRGLISGWGLPSSDGLWSNEVAGFVKTDEKCSFNALVLSTF